MSDSSSPPPAHETSAMGKFIQTYSGFLSSFVIGVAGLVATSIWQYRQSEIAQTQADSQQEIAKKKAESDWNIARADILAKNMDVLSSQGQGNADRRFGVLLSLTRGNIIDPELAISYALELGKDNPVYMRSVMASTVKKNYMQLAQAFALTCLQRYGVERAAEICKDDKVADRSAAIAGVIQDDMEALNQSQDDATQAQAPAKPAIKNDHASEASGPLSLLSREDEVQAAPTKLAWLFEPYLQDLYEHRRWKEIDRFEAFSPGARLVAALVLATSRTGELLSEVEAAQIEKFHSDRRHWLASYLLGRTCDPECRARLVEYMLSTVTESDGAYRDVLAQILIRPRAEVGRAVNQVHTRLLWCQMDPDDLALFRDQVLVPTVTSALKSPPTSPLGKDPLIVNDLIGLLALPPPPTEPVALAAFEQLRSLIRATERWEKLFVTRQSQVQRQRATPPAMVSKMDLCNLKAPDATAPQ